MGLFYKQTSIVLKKNLMLLVRNKSEILKEFTVPFISTLVIVCTSKKNIIKNLTKILIKIYGKNLDFAEGTSGNIFDMMLPIYLPAAVTGFSRKHLISFVSEKQDKIREFQKINGLKQSAYMSGWLIFSYIKIIWVWLITMGTIYYSSLYNEITFFWTSFSFFLYLIASVHQSFALSPFFNNSKLAGEIGTFIMTLSSLFYYLVVFGYQSKFLFILVCLIPQPAISFAIMSEKDAIQSNIDTDLAFKMLIFDIFIYFLLYLYFEEVFPNEYGIKRAPLFFTKKQFMLEIKQNFKEMIGLGDNYYNQFQHFDQQNRRKNQKNNHYNVLNQNGEGKYQQQQLQQNENLDNLNDEDEIEIQNLNNNSSDFKDLSSAEFHENLDFVLQNKQQTVKIENLTKNFGKIFAVNGISFNLYQSEIFCLLGHNGSGKTTTISLLTGMLSKNKGSIKVYNKQLEENLGFCRQYMGICPQKDILYDDLNCIESLEFIGGIRGLEGQQLQQQVNYLIDKTGLQQHKHKLTQNLSGGNKRKLSIALALIGNSQILFLDEPTSGMDPISRRHIWDILQEIKKEGKSIIFTTHHLDEADILADRVAVMSKGKLLIMGSKQMGSYSKIFQGLENLMPDLGINLEMNSLEEAYLNIDKNQEKDLKEQLMEQKLKEEQEKLEYQLKSQKSKGKYYETIDIELQENSRIQQEKMAQKNAIQRKEQRKSWGLLGQQIWAMFLRQKNLILRDWSMVLMLFLPLIFIYLGVMVGQNLFSVFGHSVLRMVEGLKIFFVTIFVVYVMLCYAYSFSSSIYINTPVMEKEHQIKYVLNVMGIKSFSYWMGTFLFDYLSYILISSFFFVFVGLYNNLDFLYKHIGKFAFIQLLFGPSLILFSYNASFFYKSSNSAFKSFPIISFFVIYSVPQILQQVFSGVIIFSQLCDLITYMFSPFKVLEMAFTTVNGNFSLNQMQEQQIGENNQGPDYIHYCWILKLIPQDYQDDEGVQKEFDRVFHVYNEDKIKVQKLYKIYENGFHAVKGTTFGVEKGQIFGLLGPNGSGKSSTFKAMTGNIHKSNGKVLLNGEEIGNITEFDGDIGVCPQEDTLWPQLTPREHLTIFGLIKGVSKENIKEQVEKLLRQMQLQEPFADNQAKNLSGGNKRKLCVANSLINSPSLQFFDEPSTGLDPVARKYLWNCLQQKLYKSNQSIVLTTHSLGEAESLCQKIGIQVNGKFECLDDLQSLRNKFGNGIQLVLKLKNENNRQTIINLLKKHYQNGQLKDFQQNTGNQKNEGKLHFIQILVSFLNLNFSLILLKVEEQEEKKLVRFILPYKGFLFSKAFELLYNVLQARMGLIEDFQISQQSLEQIFLQFSKKQIPPKGEEQDNSNENQKFPQEIDKKSI
ncbi:P-loop containing nucleoside triphosphate hydrolase [Pseudocohnilembus persalinus]|uniref:p-loop containing nucleoside triphosphate hydrolase n=1 Tax=Pseudocohnilembus persalinus TaxID=266149 RepID=A0A0V0QVU7_PSEPJ|nr:P-loop containing nucleoside triphosphate hydrolase [Pseudocohnilembus persalinus]|eukprot:KRX06128.1 P-loop containing nucleoside triphosphate hydrolase [Pseudocohnilembus persalinus]